MFVDVRETVLNYDGIIVIIIGLQIFMKIRTFKVLISTYKVREGKSFIYFWRLKFLSKLKHRSICQTKK